MDEIVLRGMQKWPDVPAVFGWLSLDRRGRWRLRGEPIGNRTACDFIARNYEADAHGRWYFQNGPQRVYVALEVAPLLLGLKPDGSLVAHTGTVTDEVTRAVVDGNGDLLLATPLGPGLLDPGDLAAVAERFCDAAGAPLADQAVEAALAGGGGEVFLCLRDTPVRLERVAADAVPTALGFVREPGPLEGDGPSVGP